MSSSLKSKSRSERLLQTVMVLAVVFFTETQIGFAALEKGTKAKTVKKSLKKEDVSAKTKAVPQPSPTPSPSPTVLPSGKAPIAPLDTKAVSKPEVPTPPQKSVMQAIWESVGLGVGAGVSTAKPTVTTAVTAPRLMIYSFTGNMGYNVPEEFTSEDVRLTLGLELNYQKLAQMAPYIASVGNMTGSRFSAKNIFLRAIILKEYLASLQIQLGGNYKLARPMEDGSSLQYESARGYKASIGHDVGQYMKLPGLFLGADVELLKFNQKSSTTLGTKSTNLSIFEIGASLVYVFK